jgi:hypothetical protein
MASVTGLDYGLARGKSPSASIFARSLWLFDDTRDKRLTAGINDLAPLEPFLNLAFRNREFLK